jgi:hypothetical protein
MYEQTKKNYGTNDYYANRNYNYRTSRARGARDCQRARFIYYHL